MMDQAPNNQCSSYEEDESTSTLYQFSYTLTSPLVSCIDQPQQQNYSYRLDFHNRTLEPNFNFRCMLYKGSMNLSCDKGKYQTDTLS